MIIKKCVIELANISVDELKKLEEYLNTIKAGHAEIQNTTINKNDNIDNTNKEEDSNLKRLRKFKDNLTSKQSQVFDFFMENEGSVYADDLKNSLPFLQAQGALPGVFKATRHFIRLGGSKDQCPFNQIEFDRNRGCGLYRGLTHDEIEYLKKP